MPTTIDAKGKRPAVQTEGERDVQTWPSTLGRAMWSWKTPLEMAAQARG